VHAVDRAVAAFIRHKRAALSRAVPAPVRRIGRVEAVRGLALSATLPGARVGGLVEVDAGAARVPAEVVGFEGPRATFMVLGEARGVSSGAVVRAAPGEFTVRCGDFLLGRVLDGLGRPIDGRPPPRAGAEVPVGGRAPDPLARLPVRGAFETGIRAIDGMLTLGRGQRVGLFAGSGVGKSTLLGQIARHARADVNVVCLVGERGREVGEFIRDALGPAGLARSVVVCATGDQPPMVRVKCAHVATAIAEHFRDRGGDVLLMMDSVTRFARAQREVGLAAGEPPARQGYPPSVFRVLPELLERAGNGARGSMTAIYTVLVAGGDMEEPIADEVRGILDGHVVLSRELAARGHYPAIDVLASVSRVMPAVADTAHRAAAGRVRALLGRYEAGRDLISIGAYRPGCDAALDEAVARMPAIDGFLRQENDRPARLGETTAALDGLAV